MAKCTRAGCKWLPTKVWRGSVSGACTQPARRPPLELCPGALVRKYWVARRREYHRPGWTRTLRTAILYP